MTVTVHNVIATGRCDVVVYEEGVVGRMYTIDVLAHSNRALFDDSLFENHFCFFTQDEERLAGRFTVMSHDVEHKKGIHIHRYLFRSLGVIEVPDDFYFNESRTNYYRTGSGWSTT